MMRRWVVGCGLLGSLLVTGCSTPAASPPEEEPPAVPATADGGTPSPEPEAGDDPFAEDRLRTWSLALTPENWKLLQETALDEEYVPAQLTIDGEDLGTVGVHYKGSFGTLFGCFDASTGEPPCPKISLKVKFDKYDQAKRWKGLKRINLHSLRKDPTLLHERLGYQLFREMGVPAPRSVHGQVVVNGQLQGVFAVTEEIDGRFTAHRWPENKDGNLYKEAWPLSTDPSLYQAALKTNEDSGVTHEKIVAFARELAAASPEARVEVLQRRADLDHLFRYLAVDQAIANVDGITGFYCDANGDYCENHNFYWYEDGERFWLIPWDLDLTFGFSHGFGTSVPGFDRTPLWNDEAASCATRFPVWDYTDNVIAAACDPLLRGVQAAGHPGFAAALQQLLDGPFQVEVMTAHLDRWAGQLEEAVRNDPAVDYQSWRSNLEAFKRDLIHLRVRAERMRDRHSPSIEGLQPEGLNSFESSTDYTFASTASVDTSQGSSFSAGLNRTAALSGSADARLEFSLRNDPAQIPWWQWVNLRLRFAQETVDLTSASRLTVRVQSNVDRRMRIELDGPGYHPGAMGLFGWTVEVPAGGARLTLDLADLALPSWVSSSPDSREEVLRRVGGVRFSPEAVGREESGFFPFGVEDSGWLQVDDLEFLYGP